MSDIKIYQTLDPAFLQLMDEIGIYGLNKYGEESIAAMAGRGNLQRTRRTTKAEMARHAGNHNQEYLAGIKHDNFGTLEHQLAAAAFNPMIEYVFYKAGK